MSFDDKPTEELIKLAKAGLGFTIDPDRKPPDQIKEIIHAAFEGGATISFVSAAGTDRADGESLA